MLKKKKQNNPHKKTPPLLYQNQLQVQLNLAALQLGSNFDYPLNLG